MDKNLCGDLENFKGCADQAPEGCYEDAKKLNEVIGETCRGLMKEIRSLGLKADACDLICEVEAALYDYVRRSNPGHALFPTAEGFGASMNGPARERVITHAAADRALLLATAP